MTKIIEDLPDQKIGGKELTTLLFNLSGYQYTWAKARSMRWGKNGKLKQATDINPNGFFQIVPQTIDGGFFEWYSANRADYQFFKSRTKAVLHFIFYWTKWKGDTNK